MTRGAIDLQGCCARQQVNARSMALIRCQSTGVLPGLELLEMPHGSKMPDETDRPESIICGAAPFLASGAGDWGPLRRLRNSELGEARS